MGRELAPRLQALLAGPSLNRVPRVGIRPWVRQVQGEIARGDLQPEAVTGQYPIAEMRELDA